MSSSRTETLVQVQMPQMGISVSEGTILEWRKAVGDEVAADETICEVTTDKVDVEIPCPAAGVLTAILAEPGQTVPVGEVIAEIGPGVGAGTPNAERNGAAVPESGTEAPHEPETTAGDTAGNGETDRSGFVSPVVRRMAAEHGVDLAAVAGGGVGGRIRKKDLVAHVEVRGQDAPSRPMHIESPYVPEPAAGAPATPVGTTVPAGGTKTPTSAAASPTSGATGRREPMTPMRKTIAEHMVRSRQTAAHCTTIVEVDFSAVAVRRAELKEAFARRGAPLTYLAFVATAVTEALGEFPVLNSSVEGDEIVFHDDVNLGVAVALDQGLIVPVIPRAQRLSLEGMAAAIADLASRARERKLEPDEVHGGTFTITNPGQFGAVLATPIINQPQVAILDLEAIVKRPVVIESPAGDAIAVRPMGFLPMSWDHRALDGAAAARFLGAVKDRLETGAVG